MTGRVVGAVVRVVDVSEVGSGVRGICPVVATARAANRETDAMHLTVKDGSIAN